MTEHYQIAVIGAGPGGYIAALKAARMGAKTAIVEKHHVGGTCLNYGCIPSKALLASAELLHRIRKADSLGIRVNGAVSFDWPSIQKRKDKVLMKLRGGIKGLFAAAGVTLHSGRAVLDGPGRIAVLDEQGSAVSFTADSVILAPGSIPARIPGWPTDTHLVCTSDEALHWKDLPQRLLIVGGGVIGCEFACMMQEYGVEVAIVEMLDSLLPEMETALGAALKDIFIRRGIAVYTGSKVDNLSVKDGSVEAVLSGGQVIKADRVLTAAGRKPAVQDLGLETVGLETERGFVRVDDRMQTKAKNYYCIGDANGRCLLAHAASAQGETAVENALGHRKELTLPIPSAVYTFPEIASVGLSSRQARRQGIPVRIGEFPVGHLGKAMAVGEETGFVRVIRHFDSGRLLGVHMLGHNATEIIEAAAAVLMVKGSAADLAEMIFAHPTLSEAVKEAAGDAFQSALHLPPRKMMQAAADVHEIR
ncbi:MAG TPA: dihydrolipoyl dehydrogenase [Anaerohalosphaeraceae bacterium]|nr:dihydrolipoyl dehydrogenase [Anaerohalosphaeraceae bacterium]HOM76539.1 dihydrolipoyl dehydrogenase [Anaerohalosphaeraceae bacterium]HPC63697.1 dihydrolipoyl dehydrogenase [Anaerohalosphaeraceae bacterium]HPO69822.1 dihydrolipoyl dehydrogenase [Anaerohalosphaeraceae bacterium]HRS71927.1 dihydrolipoyl dehydrogenase [Anaerohalosphaeraceae bacterium]